MKDIAFADVAADFDRWVRADITPDEMIDGLIAGSHRLAEERDEARGDAALRLALIHTQSRELAALRLRLTQQSIEIAELGGRLAEAEAAVESPPWLPWGLVLACCVALYVRLGV